jgi:hypothetical protein
LELPDMDDRYRVSHWVVYICFHMTKIVICHPDDRRYDKLIPLVRYEAIKTLFFKSALSVSKYYALWCSYLFMKCLIKYILLLYDRFESISRFFRSLLYKTLDGMNVDFSFFFTPGRKRIYVVFKGAIRRV